MKIIVHGNPIDGLQFIGPFDSETDIPERFTEPLDEWWIAQLDEPSRSILLSELSMAERGYLEDQDLADDLQAAIDELDVSLSRDLEGIAWAFDDNTSTLYNLTAGTIPPTE
jgi:hypothetical protein